MLILFILTHVMVGLYHIKLRHQLLKEEKNMYQKLFVHIHQMKRGEDITPSESYVWYDDGKVACVQYVDLLGRQKEVCEIYEP